MAWEAKVNRHVQVIVHSGATFDKIVPGVITGFATDTNPILRVGRHGETYGNGTTGIPRRTDPDEDLTTTKYISY